MIVKKSRDFLPSFKTNFRSVNRPLDHGLMPQNTRWQDRPLNTHPGTIMTPRRSHRKSRLVPVDPVQQEGSIVSTIHSRASLCLTTNCFNPSVTSICVSQIVEQYPLARDLIPAGHSSPAIATGCIDHSMNLALVEQFVQFEQVENGEKWGKNLGMVGREANSWGGMEKKVEVLSTFVK